MNIKRKWLWLSVCAVVPLIGVVVPFVTAPGGHPESVFREAGYLTLRLTTDYHAPGSIYKVENESGGFVSLHPTCEVADNDFAGRVIEQRTADFSEAIDRKLSAGYKVAPKNWKKLKLSGHLEGAQEVKAVYSNSRVLLLSTENIQRLLNDYLQRSGCFNAVRYELSNGYNVCQTEAVIVSDLVYDISYQSKGGISLNAIIESLFGAGGNADGEVKSSHRVEGQRMYHAVKLHRGRSQTTCIRLNNGGSSAQEQAALDART